MKYMNFLLPLFVSTLPLCVIFLFLMQALLYKNYSGHQVPNPENSVFCISWSP